MQPKFYGAAANYNKPSGSSMSNAKKLLTILGIFFGVIIVLVIGTTIIGAISRGPVDEFSRLITRVDNLVTFTQNNQGNIRNNDFRRINSTASMLLTGDAGSLGRQLLPAYGADKIAENIPALEIDNTSDTKLKEASLIGTFDVVYMGILRDKIAATASLAQSVDASAGNANVKKFLSRLLENLSTIDRQLTEVKL